MKRINITIVFNLIIICSLFSQTLDDGWNIRELDEYESNSEVARISLTFKPGFDTYGNTDFHAYIDPDLPLNGGIPVTDGEFNMNYIRQFTPIHNNATATVPDHYGLDYSLWNENITFFDGLGREIQKIVVNGSPANSDIIQPIVYDDLGRIKKEYLPYAITQLGGQGGGGGPGNPESPGGYRPNFLPEQKSFYYNYYPDEVYATYAEKKFDGSPLNRVMKLGSAGNYWDVVTGNPIEYEYTTNTGSYEVFKFNVLLDNSWDLDGYYLQNKLFKTKTFDETGNLTIEYKDFSGKVIMTERYEGGTTYKTYYVYDDFGLLRYVLPPMALLTGSTSSDYSYYYEYDDRKRMKIKKLPGAEEVYYVYNKRDQLVLSQDGNQRENNEWLFTKYDVFNRPIMTGIYISATSTQEAMQGFVDSDSDCFEEVALSSTYGYTNDALPSITSNGCEVLTVTYYDNYNYVNQEFGSQFSFKSSEIEFMHLYPPANSIPPDIVKGQLTAIIIKILPNSEIAIGMDYLKSVHYYNKHHRLIQTISDNQLIGYDVVSYKVNFTGDILLTKERNNNSSEDVIVQTEFEYDNGKRLIKTKHKINENSWVTLNENIYDELGRLKRKYLHGGVDNSLQTVNFKYNIRNWLTDINDVTNLDIDNDLFAMQLDYTSDTYPNPQFNGNIAAMQWNTKMFGLNSYNFDYDGVNRLISAEYTGTTGNHSTTYAYDPNGNILSLSREGQLGSSSDYAMIDDLTYTYVGNQLISVNDLDDINGHHQNNGFSDNDFFEEQEYTYDDNGNMIGDYNKQVHVAEYNYMNLPQQMQFYNSKSTNKINYLYNATGTKLRKQTRINNTVETTTDYMGNFVYEDGGLIYILTPEGRVMLKPGNTFEYQYFLKDHLGNTRITFKDNGEIIQEDSYYPFGMNMTGLSHQNGIDYKNKYLYNGKEKQDEFGLGWYDYGARFYDAAIGRFPTPDQLTEKYPWITPYSYCLNNPTNSIDPDGREPFTLALLARMGIGAAIGAGIDITVQMTANMTLGNQNFWDAASSIDWTSVGASAATGAVGIPGSNVISNTLKVATIATAVTADAAVDVSIADGNQNIFNGEKSLSTAAIDAAGSIIGGKASDDIIKGAKNSISNDISSGAFSTLNNAEKSTLRQAQSVVNSQGFEAGIKTAVGLGAEAGKAGVKSVVGTGTNQGTVVPVMQNYTPPADNTFHIKYNPRDFDPGQGGFY